MDLATATDIEEWAHHREAQAQLPQLIRRLIAKTAQGLSRVSARAGEGVTLPGWDVIAQAAHPSAFVPAGLSGWEMGVGEPAPKATRDYRKRTADPAGMDVATTTFVFVTPRRWPGKEGWVNARKQDGIWADVLAYDADDLETWLETSLADHIWVSSLLGKYPDEAESLATWWDAWSSATNPALPPTLLLAGRDQHADQLRGVLASEPGTISIAADSQSEALAFIASALLAQDDPVLIERALVVRSPGAWRQLSVEVTSLVLIPTFESPAVSLAIRSGHHVVLPLGREVASTSGIRLPPLRREGVEAALIAAGLHRNRASSLATLGRRSLLSLRRTLALNPDAEVPEWAHPQCAADVAPAVLAGSWSDASAGDREAVASIAGRPYQEVVRALTRWLGSSDPPVRRVGDVWMIAAKADAWSLTAPSLTTDDLTRFRQVSRDILGAEDPSLELVSDQRIIAGLLGRQRHHSPHLVRGIADTLALISAVSDEVPLASDRRGEDEAAIVVRSVLEAANNDSTGRRWHALSGVLPLLAEAAPTEVLHAVEVGSRSVEGPLLRLFHDGDPSSFYPSGSPHSGLLWALETLAWSPQHLPHSALRLATLARLDPGGSTLNRPFNSLCSILLLWRPGTAASLDQRIQVVDVLRHNEADVAWSLMLRLIPAGQESASPTSSPEYRDWKPEDSDGVDVSDVVRAVDALLERAVADAGTKGDRWAALLERVASMGLPGRDRLIDALARMDSSSFDADSHIVLYRSIRGLVSRHRRFAYAEWSMATATVERLDALVRVFEPASPVAKHGWLFEERALDAFLEADGQERHHTLELAQGAALADVMADIGFDGLADWAGTLPKQQFSALQIGYTLARVGHNPAEVLARLTSEREMDRMIALQYIARMTRLHGLDWAKDALASHGSHWSAEERALFLRALPAIREVWTVAESLGAETYRAYWANAHSHWLPTVGDEALLAAEKLMEAGQPRAAVELLSIVAHGERDRIPVELLTRALEETIRSATTPFDSTLAQDIGELLDALDDAGFDPERIALLEWAYLPLFRCRTRQSRVLHRYLAEDPAFFTQVISLVFRPRDEETRDLSETEMAHERSAHQLLDSWRLVPGTRLDGTLEAGRLISWVSDARTRLAEAHLIEAGERSIGRVLRYGPPPPAMPPADGLVEADNGDVQECSHDNWPDEPIREVIELCTSEHIEAGFEREVYNSRGVTSRSLTEGGRQEHELARRYHRYAAFAGMRWPRTAAMLVRIAESWERDAERHDIDAALTEDTWR